MMRSYSNILLSVRKVTQTNRGKNTPGVDKLVIKTPEAREVLVDALVNAHHICVDCGRQFIDSYEQQGYSEEIKSECLEMYVNGSQGKRI